MFRGLSEIAPDLYKKMCHFLNALARLHARRTLTTGQQQGSSVDALRFVFDFTFKV